MFIFGDFSIPFDDIVNPYAQEYSNELFLINTEGYLISEQIAPDFDSGVHVNVNSLKSFGNNNLILAFANNHVTDQKNGVLNSLNLATEAGFASTGAGVNTAAVAPTEVRDKNVDIVVINAGWNLIGCCYVNTDKQGVAPLDEREIIKAIKEKKTLNNKVLLYLHWGYETERFPLPLHRQMAHRFIDAGADFIVGCHAHCLQGYEKYKGSHIFYGIGNFAFQQSYYYEGKLKFPRYCNEGAVINWNPESNEVTAELVRYSSETKELKIIKKGVPESLPEFQELSKFIGLNTSDYVEFFYKNRVKTKGLPVFSGKDYGFIYKMKFAFVFFRGKFIDLLVYLGIKSR